MTMVTSLLDDMLESHIVDAPDIARVVGTTSRGRWLVDDHRGGATATERGAAARTQGVIDVLRGVMRRNEPARLWLRRPVPVLDYENRWI